MENHAIFLLLALLAEILGTISGFGSSILFVPLASLFFDFKVVLGITAIFHVFSNLSKIAFFRKGINKDIAIKLGIPAIIFVSLGALITTFLPTKHIEVFMSLLIFFLAIYLTFNQNKKLEQNNKNLYLGGILSGFFAGIAGTGGAIRGITLAAFQLPKEIFIATSALIDLGVDLSRALIYTSNGYFRMENIFLLPFLLVISVIGTFVGKKVLSITSEQNFQRIVFIVIIATSIVNLLKIIFEK
jgi:uncharacterized membrane protein YfcA